MTADSGHDGRPGGGTASGLRRRFGDGAFGRWVTDHAMASDLYLLPALGLVAVGFGMLTVAQPEAWPPAMLTLPPDWHVDMSIRSAAGQSSFAGDFLISALSRPALSGDPADEPKCRTLELGLVDVSGKGLKAGTRALLLSGAFGGLLGTVPS